MATQTGRPRKKAPAMHECARCGRRRLRDQLVHSRTSRNYYCGPRYMDACDKRTKKRAS